ncbi:MAG: hypothetical protein H7Y11_03445 [Armatimonadetes bacterium]|nr:hypothetical protein [Anaerolineae bacterium]
MPKRAQLLEALAGENSIGILLMLQMDGVPETLQLVIATAEFDPQVNGLREKGNYVVRAIGVREHRVSAGQFGGVRFATDHPLLYQYNTTPVGLFFRGTPPDVNALLIDLIQGYTSTFGPWRQIPMFINVAQPLHTLLTGGGDLLGEMPLPLAENLTKALEKHQLETKIITGEPPLGADEHGRSQLMQALILDESYIVALDFSVELLGKA